MTVDRPEINWAELKNLKIELGGGQYPKGEGLINIDMLDIPGVDLVMNFDVDKFPFSDNSVSYIYSSHTFEHIRSLFPLLNEMLRISMSGARWKIITPHPFRASTMTPGHIQVLSKEFWIQRSMNQYNHFPEGCEIEIESFEEPIDVGVRETLERANINPDFALLHMVNISADLIANLRVHKK